MIINFLNNARVFNFTIFVILSIMNTEWTNVGDKLEKKFIFSDFREALSFVNKVGKLAEKLDHHPDICIKNYKEVVISTTTHSAGNKVTEKDVQLTEAVDNLKQPA